MVISPQPPFFLSRWTNNVLIHTLTLYWIRRSDLIWWQGMKQDFRSNLLISTPSSPTQPTKGCTTPSGSMPSTLYEQQCRFFYVPQESKQWKSCETGPKAFCPYPRTLEILTVCRCHNKGSTFSSIVLRPSVLVRARFEPMTSCSADRRISNWANWVAVDLSTMATSL